MAKKQIQSINVAVLLKPVTTFLKRFHMIIFFVITSVGIIAALLIILSILRLSEKPAMTATDRVNASFDEATIKKVDELGNSSPSKPNGRNSPFVE